MAEQLKIIIEADVTKAVAGIQSLSKVITGDFSKAAQTASVTAASLTKSIDVLKDQFQSIGKIKIDSTDLDKIQAKLNSLKVKDIQLGVDVVGSGDVNKAIDAIKAKFESLRLSPDLSVFNEIVSEINKLKSNEIVLHVDNSEALSALNKIESQFKDIKADVIISTNIDQDIARIQGKIAALKEIDIKADPSQAILAIDKIISEITKIKDADVILTADNAQALKSINQLEGQLKDIRANVVINTTGFEQAKKNVLDVDKAFAESTARIDSLIDKMVADALGGVNKIKSSFGDLGAVSLDTTQITAKIEEIKAKLAALKIKPIDVSVDTSTIDASVKSIQSKFAVLVDPKINVLADTTQAEIQIKELIAELGKVKGSEIFIKANDTQALAAINLIETELNSLLDKQIKLNIDSAEATAKLNLLEKELADLQSLKIDPKISTTQLALFEANIKRVKSEIAGLKDQTVNVGVRVNSTGLNAFHAALGKTTAAASALAAKSAGLNNFFGKVTTSSKQAANGLNNLKGAGNEASQTLLNFGRVAQDAPFGILGIANNLNPLVESFQRASVAAKATGTSLTKNLLGALKGGGGIGLAISVVSSLLIVFGDKLFGAGKKAKDAAKDIDEANEQIKGLANSVAQSITKFTLLTGVIKNANTSYEDKAKALRSINSEYKDYLDSLGVEKLTVENLDSAYNKLIDTLLRQAVVKGIQEQVGKEVAKIAEQIIKLNLPLEKTRAEVDQTATAIKNLSTLPTIKPIIDTPKFIGGLRALKQATTDGAIAAQQLRTEVVKTQGDLNNFADVEKRTVKETARLKEELKKALGPLLFLAKGFDDLDLNVPELKNTDDTLEKARRFVKEFGDIFVLPDLEETFFRGKKELLPIAKKLLDDVAKGNLQIKIPVLTEFELIPDGITPLTKDQLDDLSKRFFSDLKIEAPLIIDPTIQFAVDQGKLKDALKEAVSKGDFSTSLDLLQKIDLKPALAGIQGLNDSLSKGASILNDALTPAFQGLFDAIASGKNPVEAFFDSIKKSIEQLIKKLIQAAIQAAILSAITGGASGPLGGFGKIFTGLLGGVSNRGGGFGLGGALAGRSFQNTLNVVVEGQISGQNILLSGQRAAGSNRR